jgi:hypothetical protein
VKLRSNITVYENNLDIRYRAAKEAPLWVPSATVWYVRDVEATTNALDCGSSSANAMTAPILKPTLCLRRYQAVVFGKIQEVNLL